jgi:hypothetical protein
LIQLYAKRRLDKGFQFSPDSYLQNELESSFIYEDTPDQTKSTQEVKADMERPAMDRLVCVTLVKRKLLFGLLLKLWITASRSLLVLTIF